MDEATLRAAMGRALPLAKHPTLVDDFNAALRAAECTTPNRAAMFCAQIGHESLGLLYFEELASGDAYEGRKDLGNTRPGDGRRFKGRGPIQLTGRVNYAAFGAWCHRRGLVDRDDYFTRNPAVVATSRWGFLAASWYWTVARPKINGYCDAGDVTAVSREINGWIKLRDGTWRTPNGMDDRRARWDRCRRLGTALLPTPVTGAHALEEDDDMPTPDEIARAVAPAVARAVWDNPIEDLYTPQGGDVMPAFAALGWAAAHGAYARQGAQAALSEIVGLRVAIEKLSGALGTTQGIDPGALQQAVRDGVAEALAESVEVHGQLDVAPRAQHAQ